MLKIRLSRSWRENLAFFKIVLTEHSKSAKHWYKEVLWFYNPLTKELKIDKEKADKYISNWAAYSASLQKILTKQWIIS